MAQTAFDVFQKIQNAAKLNKPTTRDATGMKVGQSARQGDIYVTRLEALPSKLGDKTTNTQLAVGNTIGSRHIAESDSGKTFNIYAPTKDATVLTGPVVESKFDFTITHPEHGHLRMGPGVFQVTYQRDYAAERAEELARVSD